MQISLKALQESSANVWVTESDGSEHHFDNFEISPSDMCTVESVEFLGKNDTDAPVYEMRCSAEGGFKLVATWLNSAHYDADMSSFGIQYDHTTDKYTQSQ